MMMHLGNHAQPNVRRAGIDRTSTMQNSA
jgi:hypothetical protein